MTKIPWNHYTRKTKIVKRFHEKTCNHFLPYDFTKKLVINLCPKKWIHNPKYFTIEGQFYVFSTHIRYMPSLQSFELIWRNFLNHSQCTLRISDHDFCGKIIILSVKSTNLLKKLLKSWFHGKFLSVIAFSITFPLCTVWKSTRKRDHAQNSVKSTLK